MATNQKMDGRLLRQPGAEFGEWKWFTNGEPSGEMNSEHCSKESES